MYSSDFVEFTRYFEEKKLLPKDWQELNWEGFRKLMNEAFNQVKGDQSAPPTAVWDGQNLVPEGMPGNVGSIFAELQERKAGAVELTKRQETRSPEGSSQNKVPDYTVLP